MFSGAPFSDLPFAGSKPAAGGTDVTADIVATQAADTSAIASTVTDRATIAATQAADTSAVGVNVGADVSATIAPTQAADTSASGATVTDRADIAATQAADTAAITGAVGAPAADIVVVQAADTAALQIVVPVSGSLPAGAPGRADRKRRRYVEIDGRMYDVPERDLPALLEATILGRNPPATAEVVEKQKAAPAKPSTKPRKQAKEAPEPAAWVQPTVDDAQARYEALLAQVTDQASADVAQMLQRVAQRVMAELQDEEDAAIALLLQ